uniref:Cytochrome b5 heme-binding domain-containing protein n=1 Tax=Corethron hystrix TaxID=216773 RepID=A0A7S1B5D1_9STRA
MDSSGFPPDVFVSQEVSLSERDCSSSESYVSVLNNKMTIQWSKTTNELEITLHLKEAMIGNGFLGVGMGKQVMRDAEIWFCTVESKTSESSFSSICNSQEDDRIFSCCLTKGHGHHAPICINSRIGGMHYELDVIESCLLENSSSVKFRVPLCPSGSTGSQKCFDLDKFKIGESKTVDFITAYNNMDKTRTHGPSRRAPGTINLYDASLSTSESTNTKMFFLVHGLFMLVAWLLLVPTGIFIVRYMKSNKWWLVGHVTIMGVVTSMIPVSILSSITAGNTLSDIDNHKTLGVLLTILFFFMVGAGKILQLKMQEVFNNEILSKIALNVHRYGAWFVLAAAWYNCYTGLIRIGPEVNISFGKHMGYNLPWFGFIRKYMFIPIVSLWTILFIVFEIKKKKNTIEAYQGHILETFKRNALDDMPLKTFLEMTRLGSNLCIVEGMVINLAGFINSHPGGPEVFRFAQGSDITLEFLGKRPVNGMIHMHSKSALKRLRTLAVAKLKGASEEERSSILRKDDLMENTNVHFGNDANAFYPASILRIKYLTRELSSSSENKAVILVSIGIKSLNNEKANCVKLLPSSSFFFRIKDGKSGIFTERSYTPLYLSTKEEVLPHVRMMKSKLKIDCKVEVFDFVISLLPNGQMSNLLNNLKPGPNSVLQIQGPNINPTTLQILDSTNWKTLVLVAAGTGICPMMQTINHFYDQIKSSDESLSYPKIFLVWFLKNKESNYIDIFGIKEKAKKMKSNLKWVVLFSQDEIIDREPVSLDHVFRGQSCDLFREESTKKFLSKEKEFSFGRFDSEEGKAPKFWSEEGEHRFGKFDSDTMGDILKELGNENIGNDVSFDDSLFAVSGPPEFEKIFLRYCRDLGIRENSTLLFTNSSFSVASQGCPDHI